MCDKYIDIILRNDELHNGFILCFSYSELWLGLDVIGAEFGREYISLICDSGFWFVGAFLLLLNGHVLEIQRNQINVCENNLFRELSTD